MSNTYIPTNEEIKIRIKHLLLNKNIRETELAKKCGINYSSYLDRLFDNSKKVDFKDIYKISNAIDCSIYDILPEKKD